MHSIQQRLSVCIVFAYVMLNISTAQADATLDVQFNQANIDYQDENYAQAIATYESILTQKHSPNLHYNLANAYFKLGDYGPAILHYRKALILEPRNPEFKANLQFAINAAEVNYPTPSWLDNYAQLMQVNTWAWLAATTLWISVALAILPRYFQWKGILPWVLCGSSLFLLCLCMIGLYGYHAQSDQSVVIINDAPIKVAPLENVSAKSFLANGEFATISKQQGNYYLINTLKGESGYIHEDHLRKIWNN